MRLREHIRAEDVGATSGLSVGGADINSSVAEYSHPVAKGLTFRTVHGVSDLPALIALAKEAHNESRFSYIPFCQTKFEKVAARAFADEKRFGAMLAFKGRDAVGFAYCSVGEYYIGKELLLTTIHNLNVSKKLRTPLSGGKVALGLFRGIETWSEARGAHEILLHVTSSIDLERTHKLAKRLGYNFVGGNYAKTLR